jgi:hypothetical protein
VLLEVIMGLSHKTTILLSGALHRRLTQLADERGKSIGGSRNWPMSAGKASAS